MRTRVRTYILVAFLLCLATGWSQERVGIEQVPSTEKTVQSTKGGQTESTKTNTTPKDSGNGEKQSTEQGGQTESTKTNTTPKDSGNGNDANEGNDANDANDANEANDERPQAKSSSKLQGPVHYQASDSMIMMGNGTAYLHGKGDLKYGTMELNSDYIRMNMDSNLIYAHGVWDDIEEEWKGKPVFKEGATSYETNEISYNIQTQKGYIRRVVTQQGEGYLVSDRTKKLPDDIMTMAGGQYTTCDNHDHPHYYLKLTKAKVKPGSYIASGPAYLVVGDVPLPLAIPFGFFPYTNKYSSGLLMPQFGDDYTRGLYLTNLGYYFALCDYLDLQILGDIYTRGTWAIRAQSKYIWRYHFSGSLNISYRNDVTGEKGLPDYSAHKNFSVQWTHTQDAKFNPYCTFSASVNFSTSGYNRSNINSYYNPNSYSENTKSSTINYTQRFPDSPWSLSMSASLTQRTSDSTISLTAPELSVSMSRIYPFKEIRQAVNKKKGKVMGKERWYEKISMSYTMNGRIATSNMKEKDFLHSDFFRDWKTGIQHKIPINASFTLFKYLSVTPTISLTDRMYFQRIDRHWDKDINKVAQDTTNGFFNVFDFNVGLSLSTKLYGFYTPLKKLFPNSKVEKFRHVVTPSISISYHPDFGASGWGYYGRYEQPTVSNGDTTWTEQVYSRFQNGIYGNAPRGLSATLNFGVQNNLEMKVVNKKDTTGKQPYKVISLIDNFGVTGGYNFAADSMNWSLFSVNLRLKFPKLNNYSLNLNTTLDPYMYQLNSSGYPVRTNKQYWHNGRFPHWSGLRWNFSYTINNTTIKKWKQKIQERQGKRSGGNEPPEETPPPDEVKGDGPDLAAIQQNDDGTVSHAKLGGSKKEAQVDDGYVKTEIPWSLSLNYSLSYAAGSEFDYEKMYYKMKFSHYLSLSGNIGLGKGWKVSANMTYNFDTKKVTSCVFNISRDLHCWNMTASINPIGPFKSYTFHIGVNASILSDLKYDKNSNQSTNGRVDWW